MAQKRMSVDRLQQQVDHLERQLAEAQATILSLQMEISARRQIDEQRENNEEKFAIIFDKAPFAAALSKLPDGVITDVNDEFVRALGYTRNETLGRTSLEIGFNPNREERALILEQFKNRGNARNVEAILRTKSGEGRTFLLNLDEVVIGGQKYIFQTAQDITERKRAEQALRNSEELFSKAYNKSPFAMNITRWRDGAILDANDAWFNLLGWSREEILGKTTADFPFYARPEDRSEVRKQIMKGDVSGDMELHLLRKDGTSLIVNVASTIIELQGERCILGVLNDITKRRQAEQALLESEERFRAMFENAVDAIIVTDPSNEGRVLSANPAACKMFGYTQHEFQSLDRAAIIDLTDTRLEYFLQKRDQFGQGTGELTYKRRNGERFPGELTSAYFKNQNGQQNALAIIRDITERRQAEEALQESEQRYRGLFESMQEGLIAGEVIPDESGRPINFRYIDVNPATERQYSIPREQFIGRTYTEVLPQGDRAWIEILGSVALTGEPTSVERYSRVSEKWFEAHAYSPRPGQFVNILTDITERKKAEEALKASDAKMRAVFEALAEGIVFLNRNGEVEEVNAAIELTYGHDIRELTDPQLDPRNNIIRPDGTPFPVEEQPAIVALRTGATVRNVELGVPQRDGNISWRLVNAQPVLDDQGSLLGVVASIFDITERKKSEEALQRFQLLSKHSRDIILFMRFQDGCILEANAAAMQAYGYSHAELLGLTISDLRGAGTSNLSAGQMAQAHESGILFETIHRRKDGSNFPVEVSSQGATIGGVSTLVSIVRDITERKRAEEQLKMYANRLEQSNRELEQFAFMASHDLQEPLRKIEMFGDLLLERATGLQENQRNYLDRMRNAASRMRDMVDGLLQISRVATQGRSFVQVDLAQVTSEVLSDFEDQIQRTGGKVDVDKLPFVDGDPAQLHQLMQNLIGNALKYWQPGKPPEVRIYSLELPEYVQIRVQDKGIGFPQEDGERIFEPFQRLVGRNQYEGNGIGLAICRRIVERHGGEIAAISEPGQGTTFIVTLPNKSPKSSNQESRKDTRNEDTGFTTSRRG